MWCKNSALPEATDGCLDHFISDWHLMYSLFFLFFFLKDVTVISCGVTCHSGPKWFYLNVFLKRLETAWCSLLYFPLGGTYVHCICCEEPDGKNCVFTYDAPAYQTLVEH